MAFSKHRMGLGTIAAGAVFLCAAQAAVAAPVAL